MRKNRGGLFFWRTITRFRDLVWGKSDEKEGNLENRVFELARISELGLKLKYFKSTEKVCCGEGWILDEGLDLRFDYVVW